ncbi:hypothetical protein Ocin01_17610 [Orchesella cincta]|uniref:Uncharacterized protein n=1 Tax=Orchesella cincta TaxID=48709 RepID=A0A1D2M814_ORCCI|nr:hypothetical protein Ocin01_17610 [Orchesella cincta]
MINPEPYKKSSKAYEAGNQAGRNTTGNMKVWSDPFGRKKKEDGDS